MANYKKEDRHAWSDNKEVKVRKSMNYIDNLHKHDSNNIPWHLITVRSRPAGNMWAKKY